MPSDLESVHTQKWRLYDATANTWTEETYTLEDLRGHPDPENTYICRADGLPEDQTTHKLSDLLPQAPAQPSDEPQQEQRATLPSGIPSPYSPLMQAPRPTYTPIDAMTSDERAERMLHDLRVIRNTLLAFLGIFFLCIAASFALYFYTTDDTPAALATLLLCGILAASTFNRITADTFPPHNRE